MCPPSSETWIESPQQSWSTCLIQQRIRPFHYFLSEKTEMWSAQPLLPLARLKCLQINSEILVLNCLGAWLWRNHWDIHAQTGACSSPVVCLFPSLDALRASRSLFCREHWRGSVITRHRAFHSSAVGQCRFWTAFVMGRAGGITSVLAVSRLQWRHCMLFSLLYTWPAHARKRWTLEHTISAQGICQSEIKWGREVCPSDQGNESPFRCSAWEVCCVTVCVCLRACLCMYGCACSVHPCGKGLEM